MGTAVLSLEHLFARLVGRISAAGLSGNQSTAQVKGEGEAQAAGRIHPTSLAPGVHLSIPLLTANKCG